MLAKNKITEIFCIADDFCKEFYSEIKKNNFQLPMPKRIEIVPIQCRKVK